MTKLETSAREFIDAVLASLDIDRDTDTPAATLATKRLQARECAQIAAMRLVAIRAETAAADAAAMTAQAQALAKQAATIEAEAEHLERTARGTVAALYGDAAPDVLAQRNMHPLRVVEARNEARALRGRADDLLTDAKGMANVRSAPVGNDTITRSRLAGMTPGQVAGGVENIAAAALAGRIVEG